MGILRFLLRLFSTGSKPQKNRIDQPTWKPSNKTTLAPQLQSYAGPNKVVYGIKLVESLHGRCYVVDGDTITIGTTNIRLSGVDAPEMDQPYGKNAKWALFNL